MRWLLLFALALGGSTLAANRSFGVRCKEACLRHVKQPRLQATVCGRCFVALSSDRGGWAASLGEQVPLPRAELESATADPDWAVRLGAVRALAKARKVEVARELAARIGDGRGPAALVSCVTAARAAAARKLPLAEYLGGAGKQGSAAAARCSGRRDEIRGALELELYSVDRELSGEALRHLSSYLGAAPARVVLGAMSSRPPESDPIVASLLVDVAEHGGPPAGLALLSAAKEGDEPLVNRLLAVYAALINRIRPQLTAAEVNARREAVAQLSGLGPLAARELERLLSDEDPATRASAARALARGEGKSLAEALKSKLSPPTPWASQVRWIEFTGRGAEPGCGPVLAQAAANVRLEDKVRGAAYAALGSCQGAQSLPVVRAALSNRSAEIRAGAVLALGAMPRVPEAEVAAAAALADPTPEVLAAAVRTVATQRQRAKSAQVALLATHESAAVRVAVAEGLGVFGDPSSAKPLSLQLSGDPEAAVRLAAAKALGAIGGPFAMSALTHAASSDADGRVRFVANESLRRLGFQR